MTAPGFTLTAEQIRTALLRGDEVPVALTVGPIVFECFVREQPDPRDETLVMVWVRPATPTQESPRRFFWFVALQTDDVLALLDESLAAHRSPDGMGLEDVVLLELRPFLGAPFVQRIELRAADLLPFVTATQRAISLARSLRLLPAPEAA